MVIVARHHCDVQTPPPDGPPAAPTAAGPWLPRVGVGTDVHRLVPGVPMFLAAFAYWGVGMSLGAGLGLGLGWGPRGMWIGLIAGLTVAAVLLGARFLRSSRRVVVPALPPPDAVDA